MAVYKTDLSGVAVLGRADCSGIEICGFYEFVGYWKAWMDSTLGGGKIHFSSW